MVELSVCTKTAINVPARVATSFIFLSLSIGMCTILSINTVNNKSHFVFDYNSGLSWSTFILSVPVKRERITLQNI